MSWRPRFQLLASFERFEEIAAKNKAIFKNQIEYFGRAVDIVWLM